MAETKNSSFVKEILRPVIIITVICLVVSGCLALTDYLTADKIAERAKADEENAMRGLLVAESYEAVDLNTDASFTVAKKGNEIAGYIIKTSAKGYGGDVVIMTAIGTDEKIIGVDILDVTSETPGLGQNAAREDFYSQLIGKVSGVKVQKNNANADNNEINAVTGATITSRAVEKAVGKAFDALKTYKESEAK
ncbi:MAG: FMN-binding protein [Clostridiales bacterium]|nr:FMN-binding protein [Candidatus Equinaster intestinalis]